MKVDLESSLDRWMNARILDAEQAERIRRFESGEAPDRRARWPVILATALGGVLLSAGVLLFVAAHTANLSPSWRMALLVAVVGGFHAGGALSADRFPAMSITLHAVGTAALGGALELAAQLFNIQEHWPTTALLSGVGGAAGWILLRQWPQLAMAAILIPCWMAGEWSQAYPGAQTRRPSSHAAF